MDWTQYKLPSDVKIKRTSAFAEMERNAYDRETALDIFASISKAIASEPAKYLEDPDPAKFIDQPRSLKNGRNNKPEIDKPKVDKPKANKPKPLNVDLTIDEPTVTSSYDPPKATTPKATTPATASSTHLSDASILQQLHSIRGYITTGMAELRKVDNETTALFHAIEKRTAQPKLLPAAEISSSNRVAITPPPRKSSTPAPLNFNFGVIPGPSISIFGSKIPSAKSSPNAPKQFATKSSPNAPRQPYSDPDS